MAAVVRLSTLRSRLGGIFLVLAVAFGVLPATAFVRAEADTIPQIPDTAADAPLAAAFAKMGHKRVQVLSELNETSDTVANPDGTFTLNRHLRPVRVKQGSGWVAPDPTLAPKGDALAPKAAVGDVSLSAGRGAQRKTAGEQPLIRLGLDGTTTGLDWPGALPAPLITGAIATYPEVLPGVDLKVEVDVDTVREVVVVKTPEAAKNPALAKLELNIPVQNGSIKKDADGTLHVLDAKGTEKFSAPPAIMWDSSGLDVDGRDFVHGAAPGGRQAAVGESLVGTKLTLTPDQSLLTDKHAVYPVYVDPAWQANYCTWCNRNHYLVQYACGSGKSPGNAVWDSDDNLRAGYINDPKASCNGSTLVTTRSFVEMNTSGLGGKVIYGASLNLSLTNPGYCGALNNVVWAGGISPGLAFNSGPPWWQTVATVDGCTPNVGFDITSTIASVANSNSPSWTFGIVSSNEGDQTTWKRYSTTVGFTVTYNSVPNQPTNLAIYNGTQSYPCVQGASRPVLGPTSTGYVVRANVSDPDGYELYAGFRVYTGLVSQGPGHYNWDGQEFGVDNVLSDTNTANRNAAATLAKTEMNADGFYSWDVHAWDGKDTSWAVPCEVEIELSAPAAPAVSSQTYPSGSFGGGPGRPGDFTFTVTNSPTTVDHYVWKLDSTVTPTCNGTEPGTVKPAAFNGPGTTAIAPPTKGAHILSVWSCNRAQTSSARTDYSFNVKDAAAPVASWQFEGNGNSQVAGLRYAGAGTGNFGDGKVGQAATFTGQFGDYFATSARVLDTSKSFSVSAWANVSDLNAKHVVLSQDGDQTTGFALQYAETGKWTFSLSGSDVASPTVVSAASTAAPTAGTWTHLTGVYDASAHTATLYVNGAAQQTVSVTGVDFTGPLVIGGGKASGVRANLFKGSIDEAAVFGKALSATDVLTLYNQNGVPTGLSAIREYKLDGGTADATGSDNTMTLAGSNGYGPGYSDSAGQSATESPVGGSTGQALNLPNSLYAQTSGPVLDTSQSFTVSVWVKPADLNYYAIVTQEGVHTNAFMISMAPDSWGMGITKSDVDGGSANYQWAATGNPVAGIWTHLVGVYDSSNGKEQFYVNGKLAGATTIPAGGAWRGTGPLAVGKVYVNGSPVNGFHGSIDQVQVWDRPLPADEIAGLANTAVLRANYQLNGDAIDSVSGTAGVLSGSVSLTTDDKGANVARFPNQTNSQIEGPRPQNFRSDRSFTVEGWVKHTWTAADAAAAKSADPSNTNGVDWPGRSIVGSNASQFSPYLLGHRGIQDANGVWHPRWSWLLMSSSATVASPNSWVVMPDGDAESNVWTHLTGTYDAVTRTACIYATTDAHQYAPACMGNVDAWNGANDLEDLFLGRGRWSGKDSDYWYGDIRGVRIYSGVLDAQHINADAIVDHP